MKMRLLLLGALFLTGCATLDKNKSSSSAPTAPQAPPRGIEFNPISPGPSTKNTKIPDQANRYIGLKGYLTRPPMFIDANSQKNFQRCLPLEITKIFESHGQVYVFAKQNGSHLTIIGINRKTFKKTSGDKVPLLDQYFAQDLSWASVISKNRQVASSTQNVCSGQTWKDMTQEQFQFVSGDPEVRRPLKTQQGQFDVWTYYSSGPAKQQRHYYFVSDRLYSWTQ